MGMLPEWVNELPGGEGVEARQLKMADDDGSC